jgi:hypothetical protein
MASLCKFLGKVIKGPLMASYNSHKKTKKKQKKRGKTALASTSSKHTFICKTTAVIIHLLIDQHPLHGHFAPKYTFTMLRKVLFSKTVHLELANVVQELRGQHFTTHNKEAIFISNRDRKREEDRYALWFRFRQGRQIGV